MKEHIRNLSPLPPAGFFRLSCEVPKRDDFPERNLFREPYLLPDTSNLLLDDHVAKMAVLWNDKGLKFAIQFEGSFDSGEYPNYRRGDSVEIFINTRPENAAPIPTRFCHHFVFVPEQEPLEVTRLRADEDRPLCQPSDFKMETEKGRKTTLFLTIKADALYEFDPAKGLGFAYRINTTHGDTQHFPVSSQVIALENHPRTWGKLNLQESN